MKSAVLDEQAPRTYLLVFDPGEEVMKGLLNFAKEKAITAGHLTAVGAVSDAVLGFFDRKQKDYRRIPQEEQAEVLSLIGDVALKEDGQPGVHVHAVLGLPDGSTRGGHLIEAHVWPTKVTVALVDDVLAGKKPQINDTKTYNNGIKVVPSYLLKPVAVDKTNWKHILIDSGYYTEAQVK